MSDVYCKQLYRDITSNYYQRFDRFITARWCRKPEEELEPEDRPTAYKCFYRQIKGSGIVNRQTVRRWFGLDGEQSIPSRSNIFRIALVTEMSVMETQEYLKYGISQQEIQDSDYREFIARYCLDHKLGLDKCRRMIEFYEQKSQDRGKWEQESNTKWVREQYSVVRNYPEEEFLVWMHKHQQYFKGYSLTALNSYRQLIEECLIFLRKDVMESLAQELQSAGFLEWRAEKGQDGVYGGAEIERFVKNRLRTVRNPLSADKAKEKELKKFKQRIHMIQRSDLLVLVQYVIYRRMIEISELYDQPYNFKVARYEFCELADGILEMCGMRAVDDSYMLDHVLLSCFAEDDMYLFLEVIEGGE